MESLLEPIPLAIGLSMLLMVGLIWWELVRKRGPWQREQADFPTAEESGESGTSGLLLVGTLPIAMVVCWVFVVMVIPGLVGQVLRFWQKLSAML